MRHVLWGLVMIVMTVGIMLVLRSTFSPLLGQTFSVVASPVDPVSSAPAVAASCDSSNICPECDPVLAEALVRLETELTPLARATARIPRGWDPLHAPQLLFLDVGGLSYRPLLLHLIRQLRSLNLLPHLLLVSLDDDPNVCASLNISSCLSLDWLLPAVTVRKKEVGSSRRIRSHVLIRFILIWRLTALGFGVTLLDADLAFYRNYYDTIRPLAAADMIFATNFCPWKDKDHFIPYLAGRNGWFTTPIPPWTSAPSSAWFWKDVALETWNKTQDLFLDPISSRLDKLRVVGKTNISTTLNQGPYMIEALDCAVCVSQCIIPDFKSCLMKPNIRMSYHANCQPDPGMKVQYMKQMQVWSDK